MSNACVRDKDVVSTADWKFSVDELSFHENSEDHTDTTNKVVWKTIHSTTEYSKSFARAIIPHIIYAIYPFLIFSVLT